jgi:hypothetical protein
MEFSFNLNRTTNASARRLFPSVWDFVAFPLIIGLIAMASIGFHQTLAPMATLKTQVISLDPRMLPEYAMRTTLRMLAAMVAACALRAGARRLPDRRRSPGDARRRDRLGPLRRGVLIQRQDGKFQPGRRRSLSDLNAKICNWSGVPAGSLQDAASDCPSREPRAKRIDQQVGTPVQNDLNHEALSQD